VSKRFTLPRPALQILRHPFARHRLEVLREVSLEVAEGGRTGLLGPNGAGKTTLLRILAATVTPSAGQVRLLSQDGARDARRIRSLVGFMLGDERSFYWRLTARQNLRFFAALQGLAGQASRARIGALSEMLSLQAELDKPFRDLSTGMRQRLALARALLHGPRVLLVDEPTRGLDPGAAQRIRTLLVDTLGKQLHTTVLLATHNLEEARTLCDRVAFLKEGRIVAEGPTEQTLPQAASVFDLATL
jgi:ABC-2 type transport system ATP-binding protein